MPINPRAVLDGISILTDEANMKVAVKQSGKGALICATTCFVGGILLGPLGLAIGGTAGGVAAAYVTKGSFKPVSDIIRYDLTERQRQMLVENIAEAVRDLEVTDLTMLLPLMMGNPAVKQAVFRTVVSFVSNELRLQIVD